MSSENAQLFGIKCWHERTMLSYKTTSLDFDYLDWTCYKCQLNRLTSEFVSFLPFCHVRKILGIGWSCEQIVAVKDVCIKCRPCIRKNIILDSNFVLLVILFVLILVGNKPDCFISHPVISTTTTFHTLTAKRNKNYTAGRLNIKTKCTQTTNTNGLPNVAMYTMPATGMLNLAQGDETQNSKLSSDERTENYRGRQQMLKIKW